MSDSSSQKTGLENESRRRFFGKFLPGKPSFDAVPARAVTTQPKTAAPIAQAKTEGVTRRGLFHLAGKLAVGALAFGLAMKAKEALAGDLPWPFKLPEILPNQQRNAPPPPAPKGASIQQGSYSAQLYMDTRDPSIRTIIVTDSSRSVGGKPFTYKVIHAAKQGTVTLFTIIPVQGVLCPAQVRFGPPGPKDQRARFDGVTFDSSVPAAIRNNVRFTANAPEVIAAEHDAGIAVNMGNRAAPLVEADECAKGRVSHAGRETNVNVEQLGFTTVLNVETVFRHPHLPKKGFPIRQELSARRGDTFNFSRHALKLQGFLFDRVDSPFRNLPANQRILLSEAFLAAMLSDVQEKVGGGPGPEADGFFKVHGQPFVEAKQFQGPEGANRLNYLVGATLQQMLNDLAPGTMEPTKKPEPKAAAPSSPAAPKPPGSYGGNPAWSPKNIKITKDGIHL